MGARIQNSAARVYVLTGDGELAEGSNWEAAEFAGHYKIDNLVVLCDINGLGQSDWTMYRHDGEVYRRKFESQGWAAETIDGHDMAAVVAALDRAQATKGQPYAIVANTIKGHSVSFCADKPGWHGKAFSPAELEVALAENGPVPPVPALDTHSYERKSLPVKPDFPAPPPPNYKIGQSVATREAYGTGLRSLAAVNPKVYALTGDVMNSTFSETLEKAHPNELIQGYIAEQNLVSMAVGMGRAVAWCRSSTPLRAFSRAGSIRCAWRASAAPISTCAAHTAASPSAKMVPRRWRWRISPRSAPFPPRRSFTPSDAVAAERLTEEVLRAGRESGYIRTSRPKPRCCTGPMKKIPYPGPEGAAPKCQRPSHHRRRRHHAIRSAEGRR